jgi:recA bacterial DNA recombination protein
MAVATRRAALESLLRSRQLDTTLTSALPLPGPDRQDALVPFGRSPLDRALLGGVPRGQVSEIVGVSSSGRTSLMLALLASATGRGEMVALVDTLDRFDPESAASAGVELDRLCWMRGDAAAETQLALDVGWEPSRPRPGQSRQAPMARAVSRALKALGLVLSAGVFGVAVLDVAEVPVRILRGLPFTTWLRVQRLIAGSDTACVLIAGQPLGRSAGGASVRLDPRRPAATPGTAAPLDAATFHDRVRASRRPFVGPGPRLETGTPGIAHAGVWLGHGPVARRLGGLAVQARTQAGLHTATCALDLTRQPTSLPG